ncbi:MAG: pilus assembly protein [Peptococcaceae bacterium BRH_c4b]|nr:MAG: pilus assembly protein [Peptococcaceae bacterium BRH_c4b]
MTGLLTRLWAEESGQGMAEYGLILALVAVVAIGAFLALGQNITTKIQGVGNEIIAPR